MKNGKGIVLSLVLFAFSTSSSQSAVQTSIAKKLSEDGKLILCPKVSSVVLKDAACGSTSGVPEMSEGYLTSKFGKQLEFKNWVEFGKSSSYNLWKSSVSQIPVYIFPSPDDLEGTTIIAVGKAGATLPNSKAEQKQWSPPAAPRARAAGATQGAAYTPATDISKFFSISSNSKTQTINLGKQVLKINLGQRIAYLNNRKITMQGTPFSLDGKTYYPAGIYKFFDCTVDPIVGELGIANELQVSCINGGKTTTDYVKNWIF